MLFSATKENSMLNKKDGLKKDGVKKMVHF